MAACPTMVSDGSAASKNPTVPAAAPGAGPWARAVGCAVRRWASRPADCSAVGPVGDSSSSRSACRSYPHPKTGSGCRSPSPPLHVAAYFRAVRNRWRGADVALDAHANYCGNDDARRSTANPRCCFPHGRDRRRVNVTYERRSPGWWRSDRRSMSCPICYPATNLLTFRVTNDGTRRIR